MEIYFDNAATSHPKPPEVLRAVEEALTEYNANPGRSGHARALAAGRVVLSTREALAHLLGAEDPMRIVFGFNCTDMLNLAIKGSLKRGDHVVSSMLEHNSVLRVLGELERRGQISTTLVAPRADGAVDPEDIRRAIRRNTRLVVLTHASNVTGAIQPVAAVGALCQEIGVRFLIDGAQALGAMPVNVRALRCDLYAFPGHKSLLGPQGTGGLYIAPGCTLNTLREGGTGSSSDSMLQPTELPERYEAGTVNLPGLAGLGAGVKHVASRLTQIMIRERELTSAIWEELSNIQGVEIYSPRQEAARAGIVSFNLGDLSSSQTADALDRSGIAVRGGLHCAPGTHRLLGTVRRGAVRVSVGNENSFDEIDAFIKAVREMI